MSSVYQEGKESLCEFEKLFARDEDAFVDQVYLAVSTGGRHNANFETSIFKLNPDMSQKFKRQSKYVELKQLITIQDIFLLNTSHFNLFVKNHSQKPINKEENRLCYETDHSFEWHIHKNFLALNGWNHNQRDKNTDYKFIEILNDEQESQAKKHKEIEVIEIQLAQSQSSLYFKVFGVVTNPLVRYFMDQDSELIKPEVLLCRIPTLHSFNVDQETLQCSFKKCQPQELESTCQGLYQKYMAGVKGLMDHYHQNFLTHFVFDNAQSKFFMIFNYWLGDKDQMFFIDIDLEQHTLEPLNFQDQDFSSALDRNLCISYQNSEFATFQKFTICKKMSNVLRTQRRFYVAFKFKGQQALKPILDLENEFEVLNSPRLNIFMKSLHLPNQMIMEEKFPKLYKSIGYCEQENFFINFKNYQCYKLQVNKKFLQGDKYNTQLLFKELQSSDQVSEQEEIQLICPKVRSVEDDRWTMPFVAVQINKAQAVTRIWFVMLNLQTITVEKCIDLNLTNLELAELKQSTQYGYQQFSQIQLCQSLSCFRMPKQKSQYDKGVPFQPQQCYEEKIHIAITLPKSVRIMVFEMSLIWIEQEISISAMQQMNKSNTSTGSQIFEDSKNLSKQYNCQLFYTHQCGQKEIIGGTGKKFDNCVLLPVFDKFSQVSSTQILMRQDDDVYRIILKHGFQGFNYVSSQDFLHFGYKIFRKKQSQTIDILQIDVLVNNEKDNLFQIGEVTDYALSQILSIQIKTILNMVPYDFIQQQYQHTLKLEIQQNTWPIQLLQGQSRIDLMYKKPHHVKSLIQDRMKAWFSLNSDVQANLLYKVSKNLNLISLVIGTDTWERQLRFVNQGLGLQQQEICYDLHQSSCLQRCFTGVNSVQLMNSADIIIDHMLNFRMTETGSIRNMLVSILPYVASTIDKRKVTSKNYIKFFIDQAQAAEMLQLDASFLKDKKNFSWKASSIQQFEQKIIDHNNELPKYMDDELKFESLTLNSRYFGLTDLQNMVKNHIKRHDESDSSLYEVQHSYIDLRPIYLNQVRQRIDKYAQNGPKIKNTERRLSLKQLGCDEYLLADCTLALTEEYFDHIDSCSVLKKIIREQYNRTTFYYYISLFVFYYIGFVWPFNSIILHAIKGDKQDQDEKNQFQCEFSKLNICLFTQTVIFYLEIVEIREQGWDYFKQLWNWVDILNYLLFVEFFMMRNNLFPGIESGDNKFLPVSFMDQVEIIKGQIELKSENDLVSVAVTQATTVFLLTSIIMKALSLLKVMPSIGAFTAITYSIMGSTAHFLVFFFMWVLLFMMIYMIMGIRLEDPTDLEGENFYQTHNRFEILQHYFLLSVKNSISGPEDPTDNFWSRLAQHHKEEAPITVMLMNLMILLIWIVGIVLLLVFLLNLNISLLGDAYAEYSDLKEMYTYKQQALMNKECNLVLGSFPLKYIYRKSSDIDCIIISSATQTKTITEKDSEVSEALNSIKEMIASQNTKMENQNDRFDKIEDKMSSLDTKLDIILQSQATASRDNSNQLNNIETKTHLTDLDFTLQTPSNLRQTIRNTHQAKNEFFDVFNKQETSRQKKDQMRFLKAKQNRERQIEIEIDQQSEFQEDDQIGEGDIDNLFGQQNNTDDDIFGQNGAQLNTLVVTRQEQAIEEKRPSSRAIDTQLGLNLQHNPQNIKLSQRFEFRESMLGQKTDREESSDSENEKN